MKGHSRQVNDCTSDSSGKLIVSVGWDCALKVWNGQNGKFQYDLKGDQLVYLYSSCN